MLAALAVLAGWLAVLAGWLAVAAAPALAAPPSQSATRVVAYHGVRLSVPRSWPVIDLARSPHACVRFDRHAVYLGAPGADQLCPAQAAGRTEAILVAPLGSRAAVVQPSTAAAAPGSGSSARLVDAADGVAITATWAAHPALVRRALGVRSLAALAAASRHRPAPARLTTRERPAVVAPTASPTATPGEVYTGVGFDACSTPSAGQMAAWSASPYRALGVYIGGANMACSQSNLTATWVSDQSVAGWHLVPIYVGLQSPGNSCGCAAISPADAVAEGQAAAIDAVAQAQAIGLGAGNPIYDDMEAYPRTSANTATVLAFLGAWTTQLHSSGYLSGIYSSDDSGIADLVSEYGTGYAEPDDIWTAGWNDQQSTADATVPSTEWASHQRLHQYDGAHNETYGGSTINIDGDYLDAATAAAGSGTASAPRIIAPAPSLSLSAEPGGAIDVYPSWNGATGISSWEVVAGGVPTTLTASAATVDFGAKLPIVIDSAYPYFEVVALGADGQTLGTSSPVATPAHVAIYGQSAFVSGTGVGGLPVGCVAAGSCWISTTVTLGRRTLAATRPERIPAGGGLDFFTLTPSERLMLSRAVHHRLAATFHVRYAAGTSATRTLNIVGFTTAGAAPLRSLSNAAALQFVGATDFVSGAWVGGLLVGCHAATPCAVGTTIVAHGRVIARGKPSTLGVDEIGYELFTLTPAGHRMLATAAGNQLAARATITTPGASASAQLVLAAF